MLGYVVSYKPEMKVREAEMYKGYYCGVCKSISRRYGQLPRMVLSYDAALLAILIDCTFENIEDFTKEGCIINPFKKKIIISSDAVDYAADAMLLLAWYKLLDDVKDEGKASAKILTGTMKGLYKRLKNGQPKLDQIIDSCLSELDTLEREKCSSLDQAADSFSKLMQELLAIGFDYVKDHYTEKGFLEGASQEEFENKRGILKTLGYHLGKWIYVIDAYDDIEENIETKAYNPLVYRFEYSPEERAGEFKNRIRGDVERNLTMYLAQIARCLDMLDIKKNKGILDNVVYIGLLKKTEDVLNKGEKEDEKSI